MDVNIEQLLEESFAKKDKSTPLDSTQTPMIAETQVKKSWVVMGLDMVVGMRI